MKLRYSSLTFTSANWDTAQDSNVTGVDDDIVDGSVTSTITVAINDGSSDEILMLLLIRLFLLHY
ncbi:MAG: hypothetical protein CM15mP49_29460 [Actinomycetota bacterium]|nr:MAG: hypothetical protein CM15mP49_29460 [Actinomycetota bacterium]